MTIKRLSNEQLKANGFERVDYMECYIKGDVVVSFGLIVAIGYMSAIGYHDYSQHTSCQVTRATGTNTADRRKNWNIVSRLKFENKINKWMELNIR